MPHSTRPPIPIHRFPGGIHPPEHKTDSNQSPIQVAPLPQTLILPLRQTSGPAAEPTVQPGDRVLQGQCIAVAKQWMSLPVHASASGRFVGIVDHITHHPSGLSETCMVIEVDGDEMVEPMPPLDPNTCDSGEIIQRIWDSGICGAGGAGFPTHVKLSPAAGTIHTLIVNAMECEPYITADDRLLRDCADAIVEGIDIVRALLNCETVIIGTEANKVEGVRTIKHAIGSRPYDIGVVPTQYPSGGEKQTIQLLTGKEVPSGGIPADIGIVCLNIGTLKAIADAVLRGRPMITRTTTLTGAAAQRRGNVEARIGTPLSHLLKWARTDEARLHKVILGGPMMGFTVTSTTIPIAKTTNCIMATTASEMPSPPPEQPCIRCGACADVCPASLLPQQLYWFSKGGELEKAAHHNIQDCIECGACSYVCPSHIPLVQYYRSTKSAIRQQQQDTAKSDRARIRFEARNARLEAEQQEKAARKAERAAKAAAAKRAKEAESTKTGAPNSQSVPLITLKATMDKQKKLWLDAQRALTEARKKDLDADVETAMEAKVQQLQTQFETADRAYQEGLSQQTNSAPSPSTTVQAAMARTAVKKLEKAIAETDSNDTDALKTLQDQLTEAKAKAAELNPPSHTNPSS